MSVKKLAQVPTITISCSNNTMLNVPLLDKTAYVMYGVYPLPVTQCILGNSSTGACMCPEFPYTLINRDNRTYISMRNKEEAQFTELTSGFHIVISLSREFCPK